MFPAALVHPIAKRVSLNSAVLVPGGCEDSWMDHSISAEILVKWSCWLAEIDLILVLLLDGLLSSKRPDL